MIILRCDRGMNKMDVYGYACIYQEDTVKKIDPEELTITFGL